MLRTARAPGTYGEQDDSDGGQDAESDEPAEEQQDASPSSASLTDPDHARPARLRYPSSSSAPGIVSDRRAGQNRHVSEQVFDARWPHLSRTRRGWAENSRPEACPTCRRPWPGGAAGLIVVGTHKCRCTEIGSHRTYECLGCGAVDYQPKLADGCTEGPLQMMAPTGGHTRAATHEDRE